MNMLKKVLPAVGLAVLAAVIIASPVFASFEQCIDNNYPNLSTTEDDDHPIKCPTVKTADGSYVSVWGSRSADCAQVSAIAANPDDCEEDTIPPVSTEAEDYFRTCVGTGKKYPNLSLDPSDEYFVRCPAVKYDRYEYVTFYAKTSADCASAASIVSYPDGCSDIMSTEVFHTFQPCTGKYGKYSELSLSQTSEYPYRCPLVDYKDKLIGFFGKSSYSCQFTEQIVKDGENCNSSSYMDIDNDDKYMTFIVIAALIIIVISIISFIVKVKLFKNTMTNITNSFKDGNHQIHDDSDAPIFNMYPDSNPPTTPQSPTPSDNPSAPIDPTKNQ